MATVKPRHPLEDQVREYLEQKYPGISQACTSFSLVRKSDGSTILTVNLILAG